MQLSVHAVCYLLRCVVEYIATDLCFKTSYTLVKACGRNGTTIFTALYIKMVHISKCTIQPSGKFTSSHVYLHATRERARKIASHACGHAEETRNTRLGTRDSIMGLLIS